MAAGGNSERAALFIYFAIALAVVSELLAWKYDPNAHFGIFEIFGTLAIGAVFVVLARQVQLEVDWAISCYTGIAVLSIFTLGQTISAFEIKVAYGLVSLGQLGAQLYAAYLLHEDKILQLTGRSGPAMTMTMTAMPLEPGQNVKAPSQQQPRASLSIVSSNPAYNLAKLNELLKQGVITKAEFEAEMKKVNGRAA